MADQLAKGAPPLSVDDGQRRGPLTMARLRFLGSGWLVGQCADRRLALWNLAAPPEKAKGKKEDHVLGSLVCPHEAGWIRGLDVHPRGEFLATGGSDRRLKLWQWQDGRPSDAPLADVVAHEGWVEAVVFSPDGTQLASVGADRQLKLWKATDLSPVATQAAHDGYPRDIAWSPDGSYLVTGGEDGKLLVFNPQLELIRTIEFGQANDQQGQTPDFSGVSRLGISHDSRWLFAAGHERASLYELASGLGVASWREGGMDIACHPQRHMVAAGSDTVRLWQFDSDQLKPQPDEPTQPDKQGAAKPGKGLPPLAGREIAQVKRGDFSLGLAFSQDGSRLALGKTDGTVQWCDVP